MQRRLAWRGGDGLKEITSAKRAVGSAGNRPGSGRRRLCEGSGGIWSVQGRGWLRKVGPVNGMGGSSTQLVSNGTKGRR